MAEEGWLAAESSVAQVDELGVHLVLEVFTNGSQVNNKGNAEAAEDTASDVRILDQGLEDQSPSFFTYVGLPTPERSRITGEIREPAERMTSLLAWIVCTVPLLRVTSTPVAVTEPSVLVALAQTMRLP